MTNVTIIGNLTSDPELRFIQSGAAVVNFTVAEENRKFDKDTNSWVSGESTFWRCSLWRDAAENVAESLTKGMRVIVKGETVTRAYEKDGEKRTVTEVQVDEIGPSLKFATARVERKPKTSSTGFGGSGGTAPASVEPDPWGATPATDEVPF